MIGSFVAVYKLLINTLPLIPNERLPTLLRYTPPRPPSLDPESGRSSPGASNAPLYMRSKEERAHSAQEGEGTREIEERPLSRDVFVRKPVARWHALVAGGIAGLAVAFETSERRLTIAQQLFVR